MKVREEYKAYYTFTRDELIEALLGPEVSGNRVSMYMNTSGDLEISITAQFDKEAK